MPAAALDDTDYSRIPDIPEGTYFAPLKKPDGLSWDWLEPAQRVYDAEQDRVWTTSTLNRWRSCPDGPATSIWTA